MQKQCRRHPCEYQKVYKIAKGGVVTHFGFVAPGFSPAQPQNSDPALRGRRYAELRHDPDILSLDKRHIIG
jgi:hypothetical protein